MTATADRILYVDGHMPYWKVDRHPAEQLFHAQAVAATPETRTRSGKVTQEARPAYMRVTGMPGGARHITDPQALRDHARLLDHLADALEHEHGAAPEGQLTLDHAPQGVAS